MPQQNPFTPQPEPRRLDQAVVTNVASPAPLGLNVLAFTTAIIGCFYAGFIVPFEATGIRTGLAAMLLVGGIILVLAGMWEYRKNYMVPATIFTSYGGFLAALGLTFMPNLGILSALTSGGVLHRALGLFFLCWAIYTAVLFLGALRTANLSLAVTMLVMLAAYVLLTIGQLASNNTVLNMVGGWLAIVTAIVAWLAALASIVTTSSTQAVFRLPLGRRLAVIE